MLAAQQNRETLGIARAIRRVRTSTFSKACGWIDVEKTVPGSSSSSVSPPVVPTSATSALASNNSRFAVILARANRTGGPGAIDLCSY